MQTLKTIFRIFIGLISVSTGNTQSKPVNLSCEHLSNPLGIDAPMPRLSWQLNDNRQGAKQTAYEIFIGTDSAKLQPIGKLKSDSQLIVYRHGQLKPFTRYYWKLKIWDKDNKENASQTAFFETGMLSMQNWRGSWISDSRDIALMPAAYFRKTFNAAKKIKSARAYIACAGLYELSVNGHAIGDHRLDPMYTRFDRRTLYVTYDVTSELKNDENCIGVLLGNGWYNHQSTAVWYFHQAPWRSRPSFCLDLKITYDDGTVETIATGKDWKTNLSPVIFNSIYTAEHYDARLEIPHWNESSYNDSAWKEVIFRPMPSGNIVSQAMVPIRDVEHIPAMAMRKFSDSCYIFDLGKNIAGVSEIKLSGEAGTIVKLKHGERLYPNDHVDQSNIDVHYRPTDDTDPFQTDIYILKGGTEIFRPRFNYKGFQYIEVTANKPLQLQKEDLSGYFMHSDVPLVGSIESSDPVVNKIAAATNNSYLSNLFGYPTDCPQREKNGWTGDAQIAIQTGLYSYNGITVYEKWLADHRDEQQSDGVLPSIIPTSGWGYEWGNGPDWTSTIAIIPWEVYQFYGDSKLLADCYENIKRYINHINDNYPSGITDWGLGDWVPVKSKSPKKLTSTCYYYADVMIVARAAKLFHNNTDYAKYTTLAEKIKSAFNNTFLDKTKFIYGSGLQTELSVPLYWGLVPDQYKSKIAASLADRVVKDSTQLDVGLLGTKAILNALSENGYADLAYQLAARRTYPSWGWWIMNGATTLYENWPIDAKSDISMNHIMFGEIGAWFYKAPGGIKPDPAHPGFKNSIIEPHFVKGLDHFKATHEGPYGKIISEWDRRSDGIHFRLIIPPGSTATVILNKNSSQVGAGVHDFKLP